MSGLSREADGKRLPVRNQNHQEQVMKKVIALALIAFAVTGCNTISGVGKDVQKVGQVITGAGGK
jgi:predicted small secreted protein